MTNENITTSEVNSYFKKYFDLISKETDLLSGYRSGMQGLLEFFRNIPSEKLDYRYSPEKWSIKEVLQHIIDTERIFMYRILRIGRGDKTELMGFDQDIYIKPSNADKKSGESLLKEYETQREASITLLESLSDDDLKQVGIASGSKMSARAGAFTILGHEIWHMKIITERYL